MSSSPDRAAGVPDASEASEASQASAARFRARVARGFERALARFANPRVTEDRAQDVGQEIVGYLVVAPELGVRMADVLGTMDHPIVIRRVGAWLDTFGPAGPAAAVAEVVSRLALMHVAPTIRVHLSQMLAHATWTSEATRAALVARIDTDPHPEVREGLCAVAYALVSRPVDAVHVLARRLAADPALDVRASAACGIRRLLVGTDDTPPLVLEAPDHAAVLQAATVALQAVGGGEPLGEPAPPWGDPWTGLDIINLLQIVDPPWSVQALARSAEAHLPLDPARRDAWRAWYAALRPRPQAGDRASLGRGDFLDTLLRLLRAAPSLATRVGPGLVWLMDHDDHDLAMAGTLVLVAWHIARPDDPALMSLIEPAFRGLLDWGLVGVGARWPAAWDHPTIRPLLVAGAIESSSVAVAAAAVAPDVAFAQIWRQWRGRRPEPGVVDLLRAMQARATLPLSARDFATLLRSPSGAVREAAIALAAHPQFAAPG